MGFKPFTPQVRGGSGGLRKPETYVAKRKGRVYTKLNSAALRTLGGKDIGTLTIANVRLYVDPDGRQVGFEPCEDGVRLTSKNTQTALNQAMEAAGLKPGVYTLEAVDLLPVRFRIRGKVQG